jgi:alpha-tubulin suppressor-like RCC1 family protein
VQGGHSAAHAEISSFKLVDGPKSNGKKENVIKAAVGISFSLVLTDTGKGVLLFGTHLQLLLTLLGVVYSFGSGEKGQLGNGRTGEHITAGNKTAFDAQSEPSECSVTSILLSFIDCPLQCLSKASREKPLSILHQEINIALFWMLTGMLRTAL